MQHKKLLPFFSRATLFGAAVLSLATLAPSPVQADEGYWSQSLTGSWRNPVTGDSYRFRSNGLYTFYAGPAKRKTGNLQHSGRWSTYNPEPDSNNLEPSEWGLKMRATRRKVLERSRVRSLKSGVTFRFRFYFPGPGDQANNTMYLGGVRFVRAN